MILADTSVWIDHLRTGDARFVGHLEKVEIGVHPFVLGELALENLLHRNRVITTIQLLPRIQAATDDEVQIFIEANALWGKGIGYIDGHLLAAVRLLPGGRLWTRDKRLFAVAETIAVHVLPP